MGGFEEGEERLRGESGGRSVPALGTCSALLCWSLCVIIDSKRSGRIYIHAKEVIGGEANPFFGARIRTEYIHQSVCPKNQYQVKTQNEKWKI